MANRILGFVQKKRLAVAGITLVALLAAAGGAGLWLFRNLPGSESNGHSIPVVNTADTEVPGLLIGDQGTPQAPVELGEGNPEVEAFEAVPLANGETLSDAEIAAILERLPTLQAEAQDTQDFRLAGDPIPPPLTGDTVEQPFPPPEAQADSAPVGEVEPLEVLRYAPEGEIPIAPFINVTFNQPMVPLGTLEELAMEEVPVRIDPALPGTWRWLGTKTLTFQYDSALIDRLPKATTYRATVPAGTRSAIGGTLANDVSWTFTTPAPVVVTTHPYDSAQPLEPIFFVAFDQRIDPQAVLETIQVTANGQAVSIQLASENEIAEDKTVKRLSENALEGRWLAFRVKEALPADAGIEVTIGPGTPSAEGPLVTETAQYFSFRTYAPLRIDDHGCGWYDEDCPPLSPLYIYFNNPIDMKTYREDMLRIEPELPGAVVNVIGNSVQITGATRGRTTYTVIIAGDIQDVYEQKLGRDTRLTFRIGSAEPLLMGPGEVFVTLDPALSKPALSVYSINYNKLDVRIYAVQPADWPKFKQYLRDYQYNNPAEPPGQKVFDESVPVESAADSLVETAIGLDKVIDGKTGQFIVIVAPPKVLFENDQDRYWQQVQTWVQVTQISLDAFADHSEMVAWASALQDGAPLGGVTIRAEPSGKEFTTDADGIVRFSLPDSVTTYLVARKGSDQAILPYSSYYWGDDGWSSWYVSDQLRWYVFDDRQMYKPGEEVHIKGWLRKVGGGQQGDVGLVNGEVNRVTYSVTGPQGNELGSGQADVNALGGFDFVFKIPEAVNLGYAQMFISASGPLTNLNNTDYYHNFQIQEFRRPEFEVTARNETPGPYFVGGEAVTAVEAKYYAGGPLPNVEVTWQVTTQASNYAPPNWPDFTFGEWTPWWWYRYEEVGFGFEGGPGGEVKTYTGKTDAAGEHYLSLTFNDTGSMRPSSVQAQATVMDVNRQAWSSSTNLLVHPADLYVGLRSERYFVERGTPLRIEVIVTDLDGNPVADRPVTVQAVRLEWKYSGGRWAEEEVDVQDCQIGSKLEPVTCIFETPVGGSYRIRAIVADSQGRKNRSQFTRWVSGGQIRPAREVEQEEVTLIPDQETYQPGDTARILVQSPFSPAEGLLTVSRSGLLYTERFQIVDGAATLEIPIEAGHIPNLNIQVDVVGQADRFDDQGEKLPEAPPRPAFATGQLNLNIPPIQRTLNLALTPREQELEPGGSTILDVNLTDANGKPVSGAELAVVVVDEAILALTNYSLTDPIQVFYSNRSGDVSSVYARNSIILANPQALQQAAGESLLAQRSANEEKAVMEAAMPAPTEGETLSDVVAGGGETGAAPIRVRLDFNPLALFAPSVRTDADGRAEVPIQLPDNLTRYRIMVVAVDTSNQFGSAETNLTARLPLMVRPSAPRFLNFGDQFELPVVLQNQTDTDMTVEVVVQGSNLAFTAAQGQRVVVPARDRIEVRFPAAAQMAGTARFQVVAVSGTFADAATIELPVYTPATSEAFATYGTVDDGTVFQPVKPPDGVFPQYGGLEIQTSSTALQALTDAVIYLYKYPFECSEQISSRLMGIAALRDVLAAFKAEELPEPEVLEASVAQDVERLQGMQNYDGGFPYWRRGQDSIPFNTIHVTHALVRAELKGFEVPDEMKVRALDYLSNIEQYYPSWYSEHTRRTLSAYALFVRNLAGDRDPAKALDLLNKTELENFSLEAIGWLWPVLQDYSPASAKLEEIRRFVNNRAVETPGAANFTTTYDEQTYLLLSSDRRTDAVLLDALMIDDPQSDLIVKVVNGLLANRSRGRWLNTQENVFVLLALDRYFNTYEAQTPDFTARIWLGEAYAGSVTFEGRSTDRYETNIPMAYLVEQEGLQNLALEKDGVGRLYYRLGLRYAPSDLRLDALDMGFVVQRTYEAMDNPEDVTRDENGNWVIKAGARVRVRISMVADNRRYHVALVDPLPAGLEIVNPALAVSESIPQDPGSSDFRYGWWWWGPWYEHQNLRDERAEAFTSLLWDGVYEYTYVARATTPGTFVVPPAKAEEMYSPEVFGRSSSDIVIVK